MDTHARYPATEARRVLTTHIETVTRRYSEVIDSFDVVNEGIDPDTGLVRDTVLSKPIGGEAAIDLAFRTARAASRVGI
jgi:endo-1,4-beta-xylanase